MSARLWWWVQDNGLMLLIVALVVSIGVLAVWGASQNDPEGECLAAGGAWAITGHYYQPVTTMAGKVPITTMHRRNEYGCVQHEGKPFPGWTK